MTLKDAKALAIKVLSKTLDMTKLTSEKGSGMIIKLGMFYIYYFS